MKQALIALGALVASIAIAATSAHAQAGGAFRLTWSSIDSGAGTASGVGFRVIASIAQADATPAAPLLGGGFRLQPGFLAVDNDRIFFHSFE